MGVEEFLCKASWFLALLAMAQPLDHIEIIRVTRHNSGDIFTTNRELSSCTEEMCIDVTSGTASITSGRSNMCTCKCLPRFPAFREDLQLCVDDIHECSLAPFVGGSTSQQIPFVFLPLNGQIIHPSKEIFFKDVNTPVCGVSGAKFLTENGWLDLRNSMDCDIPFKLFRDEGRTFLQWVGEPELRSKMSGRMVLVQLMCKELADPTASVTTSYKDIFEPCVAFRVVGTPFRSQSNVTEVAFSLEVPTQAKTSGAGSLSINEYVTIGICSVLLGLIYVASVFLYLYLRKRNGKSRIRDSDCESQNQEDEGIIKNNPLLGITHFVGSGENNSYSESSSSENEIDRNSLNHYDDTRRTKIAAVVHSQIKRTQYNLPNRLQTTLDSPYQDSSSIERLPQEDVSIVETLEARDEADLKFLAGNVRKKLYFNPAYFEPHLLMAPPPAAIEFLEKIREVIAVAKQKMASKRFTPTLLNIPEEETNYTIDPSIDFSRPSSRRGSGVSFKQRNSRREPCSGCPGCEPKKMGTISEQTTSLNTCQSCSDSKQSSIRKWLEDIPVLRLDENAAPMLSKSARSPKSIRTPAKSPSNNKAVETPTSSCCIEHLCILDRNKVCKKATSAIADVECRDKNKRKAPLPPPDMIQEAIELENHENRVQTLTKEQMKAVINELTVHKNLLMSANGVFTADVEYEADSLERIVGKGHHLSLEHTDHSPSQTSPSLSTSLPVDEEITMRNAIYNKNTGNMTISKINQDEIDRADRSYHLVVMKTSESESKLPECLRKCNGYSLVSEVYVNNGYNWNGSSPSSPSESNCSTLERRTLKVRYEGGAEKPGKLLIEVDDCLDNYIPMHESDEFEPDTLDRPKANLHKHQQNGTRKVDDTQSLPSIDLSTDHILLRTTGSFKGDSEREGVVVSEPGNFRRVFGSLRELYEERRKAQSFDSLLATDSCDGRLLTLEERHSRRQRNLGVVNGLVVQPDVIPPPPRHEQVIYDYPKPVRHRDSSISQPPLSLPSKNPFSRSVNDKPDCKSDTPEGNSLYKLCLLQKSAKDGSITNLIHGSDLFLKENTDDQFIIQSTSRKPIDTCKINSFEVCVKRKLHRKPWETSWKPEDSGYLSTDSTDSKVRRMTYLVEQNGSETDESFGDGHSESGAESVETHSVFFGRYRGEAIPKPAEYVEMIGDGGGFSSSDSETFSMKISTV
ncbi:uncharacterized protein LOC132696102 isoform X2 [Cylas formicarius]|uniref:uncharacterized protein LOC132696102 isoform X2 n=1 Tax=Cylas formicarius TaxID=197179 RepID=UPI002958A9BD|nr:uncharacterized protein LOC132696102 isoform X2 [Cylas formicarius]